MIRSVGVTGPVKVAALVSWKLRFSLLAMVVVAAVMIPIPDTVQTENATAVLSVLGICATIFIGFRNSKRLQPLVGGTHAVGRRHHQLPGLAQRLGQRGQRLRSHG